MRTGLYVLAALVTIGVTVGTQHAFTQSPAPSPVASQQAAPAPTQANVATPTLTAEEQQMLERLTPSRVTAMRTRVEAAAQRAVRDHAEQGFREPTAAEAAALAPRVPASDPTVLALSGSGLALKAGAEHVEFATATVDEQGAVVTHNGKGARRDQ